VSIAFDVFMMLSFGKKLSFAWKETFVKYFTKHDNFFQLTDHSMGKNIQFESKYCVECAVKDPE
jgi:uncharacterized membrane protein